jgi:hypothetical protein
MAAAPAVGLARMSNSTWTESGIGPSGLELPRLTRQWRYCRLTENLAEHEREPYPHQAMKNPTAARGLYATASLSAVEDSYGAAELRRRGVCGCRSTSTG